MMSSLFPSLCSDYFYQRILRHCRFRVNALSKPRSASANQIAVSQNRRPSEYYPILSCSLLPIMVTEENSIVKSESEETGREEGDSFFDSIPVLTEEVPSPRPDQSQLYKQDRIQRRNTTRPQNRDVPDDRHETHNTDGMT